MSFGRRQFRPGPPTAPLPAAADPNGPSGALERLGPQVEDAANDLVEFLVASYRNGGGVHAETVIGAAAALTGEFAQRATGLQVPENNGQHVFGDAINDVLVEGEKDGRITISQCFQRALREAGLAEIKLPNIEEVIANEARAVGGPSFPPLTVPQEHYPHEWSPNACPRLRHKVTTVAATYDLSRREFAFALALATGRLIAMTKTVLPPAVGITLATEIAFGVAKMAPLIEQVRTAVQSDQNAL